MADKFFTGIAAAIAQIATVQVTAYDAATTYKLTINGIDIVSVAGDTDVNTTALAIKTAWEANKANFPYADKITATQSTDTVTLTADVAGVPFTVSSSVTGGTGTIGSVTTTTAATGPNHWDDADNWSDGSVPGNSDNVTIPPGAIILWGISQTAVDLGTLRIMLGALIGLDWREFEQASDGSAPNAGAVEYRDDELDIGWDVCEIGVEDGPATNGGSGRVKLRNDKAGSSETVVFKTAPQGKDTGLAAVRLRANNSGANVDIRSAQGGVGFCADVPEETATFGNINVSDPTEVSQVFITDGCTYTNFTQNGGQNQINAAAGVTKVEANGGGLVIEGDFTITTLEINEGASVVDNHIKTSGNANTTINMNGGELDFLQSLRTRTQATVNHEGGAIRRDSAVVTFTTYVAATGRKEISAVEV